MRHLQQKVRRWTFCNKTALLATISLGPKEQAREKVDHLVRLQEGPEHLPSWRHT
jgi:hypothetical protein